MVCLIWDASPMLHRQKLGIRSSLLIVWCCAGDGIYSERVCLHFSPILMWVMWVFTFACCVRVAQLVSEFHSVRISLCVAVHSIHPWQEVSSGGSCVAIMNEKPP